MEKKSSESYDERVNALERQLGQNLEALNQTVKRIADSRRADFRENVRDLSNPSMADERVSVNVDADKVSEEPEARLAGPDRPIGRIRMWFANFIMRR